MSKHKEISIEQMRTLFEAYKKDTKDNPRERMQFVGKDGDKVWEELERPLTLEGFYIYCRNHASDVHNYFENTEGRYDDYKGICRAIREEIRCDQIEGGMVGQYNPSITQRLNNLVDKKEMEHKGLNIPTMPDIGNRK